ncbi:hypothetical protein JWG44_15870 [Leptospira sp. 201903071]|nr:hypothetical protein [Leptospira ainazelensis]
MKTGLQLFSALILFSCVLKPEMTFERVKQGKDLDRIPSVSLEEFFQIWIRNRKHVKIMVNTYKLFDDSKFLYFGKNEFGLFSTKTHFFKIEKEFLEREFPGYEEFYVSDLKDHFLNEILSSADKNLWSSYAGKDKSRCGLIYQFSLMEQRIVLNAVWNLENCRDLTSLSGKKYRLVYDLKKKNCEE